MALTVLDAGTLIGVLDGDDPHHAPAVAVLRRLLDQSDRLVVPASVYAEVMVAPFRGGEDAVAGADLFLNDVGAHVEPATRQIARLAAQLRAAHGSKLRPPDALVVATAQALQAQRVVTTNARWPRGLPVTVEII